MKRYKAYKKFTNRSNRRISTSNLIYMLHIVELDCDGMW